MNRQPDWTNIEFETLLTNTSLTNEELHDKLSTRSIGAIGVVRCFIDSYHTGGDISGLSNMMINRLKRGSWECPEKH